MPPERVGGVAGPGHVEFEVDSHSDVSVYTTDDSGTYTNELDSYWTGETQALIDSLSPAEPTDSTIWVVGDSTVSAFNDDYYYPRYGWGTQIGKYLDGSFDIQNIALSGRSSKSYTTDVEYQTLRSGMKDGDYLLIGFGHNDEKREPERYTNPNGTYLEKGSFANSLYENYIKPAQAAGTKVILSTPIVRRTATGEWSDSNLHVTGTSGDYEGGDYAQAIRDLGTALDLPVVDMTSLTKNVYDELGPDETQYLHAWTSSDPVTVDNTHTNIWGGAYNAYLVTQAMKDLGVNGLAEHVVSTEAPTKAETLVSNPDYEEPTYDNDLKQSTLWQDHGIWKGTVFGSVGGTPSTSHQTLETDKDGNMHIAVANNKGKIASTIDGIAMYYYKVPADSTFTLTAKAKINRFDLNNQVSFGLMARDDMYIDLDTKAPMGDYVAAAPLQLTSASNGGFWNGFARKNGVLLQGGTAEHSIFEEDTVDLSIESSSDGYAVKFGNEATVTEGFDFKLTKIDPDYVYVGLFVARNADVTFSDIKLVVDGEEVTAGDQDGDGDKDDQGGDGDKDDQGGNGDKDDQDGNGDKDDQDGDDDQGDQGGNEAPSKDVTVEIGKTVEVNAGGTVTIKGTNTKITLPDDLPAGTKIHVKKANKEAPGLERAGDAYTFEFTYPNGTYSGTFTLSLGYDQEKYDADEVNIYYFNEGTEKWERKGGHAKDGVISLQVSHFSTYGVFADSGDETPGAGSDDQSSDDELPQTATNLYNYLFLGMLLLLVGATIMVIRRRNSL
ncbi:LPXTG cell wall anchor domain-containing protein [Gracilibacillus caseinilyticus]|uniref:LPXTG cell wall anchor domain-containing protein n=2 Tax=Gracilibacillus caseinilyticus TaxID=2932256 RepID=A0ABY4F1I8_9BACI|nr:LPXTG cell wall anchor domain-containing protein [Gracilibacillus caseinilyticus]